PRRHSVAWKTQQLPTLSCRHPQLQEGTIDHLEATECVPFTVNATRHCATAVFEAPSNRCSLNPPRRFHSTPCSRIPLSARCRNILRPSHHIDESHSSLFHLD